jgi:hypothetical protein
MATAEGVAAADAEWHRKNGGRTENITDEHCSF